MLVQQIARALALAAAGVDRVGDLLIGKAASKSDPMPMRLSNLFVPGSSLHMKVACPEPERSASATEL